ncbi:MAG: hypothetical protein QGI29_06475, partial [Pirellulales bacterium]|nr:hypothetical protein [Pirellulales bacterium]
LRRRVDAGPDAGGVPALDTVDMLFRLGQVRLAKRKGGGKKEEGSFHFPKSKKGSPKVENRQPNANGKDASRS